MDTPWTVTKDNSSVILHRNPAASQYGSFSPVLNYVDDHLFQRLTLEDVAEACGISSSYVSQLFRRYLKLSFCQYLCVHRMETARQLITAGIPLEQVCKTVGYQDYSSFYRAFRKHFRCSPTKLRFGQTTP